MQRHNRKKPSARHHSLANGSQGHSRRRGMRQEVMHDAQGEIGGDPTSHTPAHNVTAAAAPFQA
ncbi:hypothetical protein EMIT053CA3_90180 [Pseudomonas donghuensis]